MSPKTQLLKTIMFITDPLITVYHTFKAIRYRKLLMENGIQCRLHADINKQGCSPGGLEGVQPHNKSMYEVGEDQPPFER